MVFSVFVCQPLHSRLSLFQINDIGEWKVRVSLRHNTNRQTTDTLTLSNPEYILSRFSLVSVGVYSFLSLSLSSFPCKSEWYSVIRIKKKNRRKKKEEKDLFYVILTKEFYFQTERGKKNVIARGKIRNENKIKMV